MNGLWMNSLYVLCIYIYIYIYIIFGPVEVTPHPSSTPSHLFDSLILSPSHYHASIQFFFIQNDLKKSCYFFRVFENLKNA